MHYFYYFLKHLGVVSSMITCVHILNMFTDKSQLTSVLISFCRINCVYRRFQELKKTECFFLLVRGSVSYTCAWPVFCQAVSSTHDLFLCIWDVLSLSVSPCSICYPTATMFTAYLENLARYVLIL